MDRHGEGMLQLPELIKAVPGKAIVEIDPQDLIFRVDAEDPSQIPVENARTRLRRGAGRHLPGDDIGGVSAPAPYYIIVVPDLHHPIALPEHGFAETLFSFIG